MPDLRRVHRFRDHPIAGVNWRPTRFVDEVPSSRVCSLCRMIPKRTVLLPCSHILCKSCHTDNTQGCGGRCPLDQEPFEEGECVSYDLPIRTANALKVHCWNEAHGCEFEGSMEALVRHYGKDCTFHAVECLRCGEAVLHRELSTHYVAGCSATVSLARVESASSDSQALTLQDVTAALEELKSLLRAANHEQLLLAIQSQMNEQIEHIRNQESTLAMITHAVAAPETSETVQVVAPSTSTSLQEGTSGQNPSEEASTSATSRACSEETLMSRQLELFLNLPREVLQVMRKTSSQDYPQHAITNIRPGVKCHLELTKLLPKTDAWREGVKSVKYSVTFENFPMDEFLDRTNIANITVMHTRDAYFTVQLEDSANALTMRIQFHGILGGSTCPAPVFNVTVYNQRTGGYALMLGYEEPFCCKDHRDSWVHCNRKYAGDLKYMIIEGYLRDGNLKFEIVLSQ